MIKSYYKVLRVIPDPDYVYFKNISTSKRRLDIKKTGSPTGAQTLEYSFDKITWNSVSLTSATNIVAEIPVDSTLYLRSSDGFSTGSNDYYTFINSYSNASANLEVGGDLTTLIDYTSTVTTIPAYSFKSAFAAATGYPDNSQPIIVSGLHTGSATVIENQAFQFTFSASVNGQAIRGDVTNIFPNVLELKSQALYGILANWGSSSYNFTKGINLSNVTTIASDSLLEMYTRQNSYSSGATYVNEVWAPNVQSFSASNWLNNCGPTGIVYAPTGATITTDSTSGIPTGWTRVDY